MIEEKIIRMTYDAVMVKFQIKEIRSDGITIEAFITDTHGFVVQKLGDWRVGGPGHSIQVGGLYFMTRMVDHDVEARDETFIVEVKRPLIELSDK